MNDLLVTKIRRAYPDGTPDLEESALSSDERDERIDNVLVIAENECSLNIGIFPFDKPAYKYTFTQKNHPPFGHWIMMDNPEKLAWIRDNHGEPYPAFWLNISRVADYYTCYYNHWAPRGNTGYLDIDCRRSPNTLWVGHEKKIRDALEHHGFSYLTDELACESVPFVLEEDFDCIPEDDPRWLDEEFKPPLVPSSVQQCLFGPW